MVLSSLALLCVLQANKPYPLMVGEPAPKLTLGGWARGEKVEAFEPGKVYVLDFFASWCVPCKAAMPKLSAIQSRFEEKVVFIAVDVWDYQERVPEVIRELGDGLNYRVALDKLPPVPPNTDNVPMWAKREGAMAKTWLAAAGRDSIPSLFIVDGRGKVAWIGHDVDTLTTTLEAIDAGSHDLKAAAATHWQEMVQVKAVQALESQLWGARQKKDWVTAISIADKLIAMGPGTHSYAGFRFQATLVNLAKREDAYAFARAQEKTNTSPDAFDRISSVITFEDREADTSDLAFARRLAERADELFKGEWHGPIITLAAIAHKLGQKERAIELQVKAIAKMPKGDAKKAAEETLVKYRAG